MSSSLAQKAKNLYFKTRTTLTDERHSDEQHNFSVSNYVLNSERLHRTAAGYSPDAIQESVHHLLAGAYRSAFNFGQTVRVSWRQHHLDNKQKSAQASTWIGSKVADAKANMYGELYLLSASTTRLRRHCTHENKSVSLPAKAVYGFVMGTQILGNTAPMLQRKSARDAGFKNEAVFSHWNIAVGVAEGSYILYKLQQGIPFDGWIGAAGKGIGIAYSSSLLFSAGLRAAVCPKEPSYSLAGWRTWAINIPIAVSRLNIKTGYDLEDMMLSSRRREFVSANSFMQIVENTESGRRAA